MIARRTITAQSQLFLVGRLLDGASYDAVIWGVVVNAANGTLAENIENHSFVQRRQNGLILFLVEHIFLLNSSKNVVAPSHHYLPTIILPPL